MSTASFVVFSASNDPEILSSFRTLLAENEDDSATRVISTLEEGIASSADVLILYLPDDPLEFTDDLVERLKNRKVIGIGHAAAQLYGQLGLAINNRACAHYGTVAPKIIVEKSVLIPISSHPDPIRPVQLSPKAMNLDHFAMHIPRHSELVSVVDVIARADDDENYAAIVRQGNFVMVGMVAPPEIWTKEYSDLFRKIAFALQERAAEPFMRAQWEITKPGTKTFSLAEGHSKISASSRNFYFRFAKPTTFSATLRHEGSNYMMLLFLGDRNREHWTREDARDGEDLKITINISEEDIKNIGDWYWYARVSNFDKEHMAACSITIEYQE